MQLVNALYELSSTPRSFTIVNAPMGWGKSRLIAQLLEYEKKIVFVSPLRAIVDNFKDREHAILFQEFETKELAFTEFIERPVAILSLTPESLSNLQLKRLLNMDVLFVIDECHLIYEWGESFREKLLNFFEDICFHEARIIALTASLDNKTQEKISLFLKNSDYEKFYINIGNFKFHNKPSRHFILPMMVMKFIIWMHILFFWRGRMLIFFRTRNEVKHFKKFLASYGIRSQICLGGEVHDFLRKEEKRARRIVLATSALSHGVNMKDMRRIFCTYPCEEVTKFQMFGRGGRYGEKFWVFELLTFQRIFKILFFGDGLTRRNTSQ